jgi:large subunit ribosomal protein L13
MAKKGELTAAWHIVDATDKVLGRMATRIATILMGKHRPEYTPHVDCGDFVVVLNAANVKLTGTNKPTERTYQRYSRYPGGQKIITLEKMLATHPDRVIKEAVRRMLPKNKLGHHMLSKLKVYADDKHPHAAQQPQQLELK